MKVEGIKAIIFDLGGVLLDIDYDKTKEAFTNLGIQDFDKMYSQADANPLFQKLETGKIKPEEFCQEMMEYVPGVSCEADVVEAWNAMLLHFRKESIEELKRLKKKYKVFLLSNTNYIHFQSFNKTYKETIDGDFLSLFDKAYLSHEISHRKPNPEAYEYVLNENNLKPAEALFIDDSIQNIEAADKLGLKTVFLKKGMRVEELGL
jgi:glucose-1-phosphatase